MPLALIRRAHFSVSALSSAASSCDVPAAGVAPALTWIARHADRAAPPVVLILGSLYLAGEVLRDNRQPPT